MLLWLGSSPESFTPGLKAGRKHELKKPKNAVLRFDVKETHRLLEVKRISEDLTWDQVAKQIGHVSPGMLRRFKKGGRTSFPAIVRITRWLDVPTKDLTKESPW
jgi:hypothetical protein